MVAPSFAEVLVVEINTITQEETEIVEQNHLIIYMVIQVGVVVPIQHILSTAVTEVLVLFKKQHL